jgi:DNA-binding CsgD family transcriptional regulator
LIVDTSLNSRMQVGLHRVNVSTPGAGEIQTLSSSQEIQLGRAFTMPTTRGAVGTTVSDLLAAGFEALDLLNIGLVVCSASGEMLVANHTAEEILRTRDGLELNSEGVLTAPQDDTGSLRVLVKHVAETSQTAELGSRDSAFAVRRPSGKRALTLFVRAVNAKTEEQVAHEAAVLVMILDSAVPVETAEAELRQLYGLTSTEAQLANLLMEGMALKDCCDELGIRRTTARMHLRNIFAKTGVRRQGELVSLLLKSIGLGPRAR